MYTYKKFPHKNSNLWIIYKDGKIHKAVNNENQAKLYINNK